MHLAFEPLASKTERFEVKRTDCRKGGDFRGMLGAVSILETTLCWAEVLSCTAASSASARLTQIHSGMCFVIFEHGISGCYSLVSPCIVKPSGSVSCPGSRRRGSSQ